MNFVNKICFLFKKKKPKLYMMVGLPGSGKSHYAEELADKKTIILSSDKLRTEMFGDVNNMENNSKLFEELHKRIRNNLIKGKNVIYDATNIDKKKRISFLESLSKINCEKICVCVMTPYDVCVSNNEKRERNVPTDVIKRMYMNWNPPAKEEGFDKIMYHYTTSMLDKKYSMSAFWDKTDNFDQGNSHHSLSLGEHCSKTGAYLLNKYPNNALLYIAGMLHDNGKIFTKTNLNAKGELDGECHYYQHHCVGAYDSLFYMNWLKLEPDEKTYISNLIFYHMLPFTAWKQSFKSRIRYRRQMGEEMYFDVLKLHEADSAAH